MPHLLRCRTAEGSSEICLNRRHRPEGLEKQTLVGRGL